MRDKSQWSVASEVLEGDREARADARLKSEKLAVYEALDAARDRLIAGYSPRPGHATAVALLSDIHVEERVDPEDVPGAVNKYDLEICQKRVEQYFQRVVLLLDSNRHLAKIDDLVLAILGDVITGFLHDDQRESNYLTPTQAVLFAEELVISGIHYLLTHGDLKRLAIVCCYGNHGRNTVKPRAKTAAAMSYEWMMYQHLRKRFADEDRIDWHIADGAHVYLDIAGFVCRFHHGDNIRYSGGVGGLSIPLMKAIAQWNKIKRADYDFLGHYHQCRDYGFAVINGSVIGYNAFALQAKCDYESPKQAFVLIDHKRGKSCMFDIWTDYLPKDLGK